MAILLAFGVHGGSGMQARILLHLPEESAGQAARPVDVPLSTYAGLLRSMTVIVAGAPHPFIFDTGGGETMITPKVASSMGCTPYGRAVGFRMSGEAVAFQYCDDVELRMGDVAVAHDRVGVFDLESVLPVGLPPAHGVVSLRSFRDRPVTIHLASGRVVLETAESMTARTRGMTPLTIRVATGPAGAETTVYVAARVGGRRVWLLLDSGNGDRVLVAPHVARMAGLKEAQGEVRLEIDGLGSIPVAARWSEIIYDGVLGAAFLQDWIFTIDLATGRGWATRAETRAVRFALSTKQVFAGR
jgi:hypothetical protein